MHEVDYVEVPTTRRDVMNVIGGIDEEYEHYYIDPDYCLRAKKAGYEVLCVNESKIWHKKCMKTRTIDKLSEGMNVSASAEYYNTRNRFRFMRNHATKCQYLFFSFFFFGCYFWLMTIVLLLFYRNPKRFVSFCSGIKDGLLGRGGALK